MPDDIQDLKQMVERALTKIDVSLVAYEQRQEGLEETTRHISEKLDALAQGLPDRFLDRAQYLIAHTALEKRVETGEARHEDLRKEVSVEKQRVSEMYSSGMQRVNDTFTGIRNLIAETRDLVAQRSDATEKQFNQFRIDSLQRDEDRRKQTAGQILIVLLSVGCGAILSFVGTLILHAMHVL